MAALVSISNFLNSPFSSPPPFRVRSVLFHRLCSSKLSTIQILASSSSSSSSSSYGEMDSNNNNNEELGRRKFMEFPYVSPPVKNLMVELVSTLESRLGSDLLPCTLPQNVQYYHNESETAQASLHIRSARKSSSSSTPIDFILGSWLHCDLPSGGALNIASLSAYLNISTDAPHFLIELVQSSPSSLILILDLLPRKDIVLHPDYLKTYYEDTQLDGQRLLLAKLPEVTPYFSSSLYIRCVVSPTAILVRVETEAAQRLEEIVQDHVSPVAKQVLGIWLDRCTTGEKRDQVGDAMSAAALKERDGVIKKKTIEIDLGSSLPRLFGPDIAGQVLAAIQEVFST